MSNHDKINIINSSDLDNINNSSNIIQTNNNLEQISKINNPELKNIKSQENNNQNIHIQENDKPKIIIPNNNTDYYYEDNDELIDLSNEIEMITDELRETFYDDMLNKNNMSLLQIKAIIGSGLIYFVEGLHVSLNGLLFIPILKNYNLSQIKGCLVSSSLMIFMAIGCLLSGFLTNIFVRKKLIIYSLLIISCSSFLSIINSWGILLLSRCIIGMSLGVINPINNNNLSEVLPLKLRSFWIIFVSSFFNVGAIFSCQLIKLNINNLSIFFSILSILSFMTFLIFYFFYNENPRYLVLIGKKEEAHNVIEKYLLFDHHKLNMYEKTQIEKSIDRGVNKEVKITGKFIFIFRRYRKITLNINLVWILYSIIINGGIFSLFVSFANNVILIPSEIQPLVKMKGFLIILQIFYTYFGVSTIISGLFTEVKCCGRKYTIFFGFLLSTIASFHVLLFQEESKVFYFLVTCLINISFNAINSYTIEVYPTRVRDFAVGYLLFVSKIVGFLSNIFALMMNNTNKIWMLYINALLGVLGLLFTLMLPFDTYQRKLDDILAKRPKERKNEIPIIGS